MLKGRDVLKELPLEIVKLYEEIETLRDKLGKVFGGHKAVNKIIKAQRNPKEKSGHGFKGKKMYMVKKLLFAIFVKKSVMKLISARTSL